MLKSLREMALAILFAGAVAPAVSGRAAAAGAAPAAASAGTPAFEGRRLWLKLNCYSCHGMHAAGGIAQRVQGLGFIVPAAVGGAFAGSGMPIFSSHLTSTDISNLSAYVNVAGTPSEPTFLQWWKVVPGN